MSHLNRVMFSVQSGSPFSIKKKMIIDTFSHFGVITYVFYHTGSNFGFVDFQTSEDANNVFNKVLSVSDCKIHTFQGFNFRDLGSDPVPYQILIKSRNLPFSWEKFIIIKEFFKKFGQVNGVIYLGNNVNGVQKVVVSFKDSLVAKRLVGTTQRILYAEHAVMEVSRETMGKEGWQFVK